MNCFFYMIRFLYREAVFDSIGLPPAFSFVPISKTVNNSQKDPVQLCCGLGGETTFHASCHKFDNANH